MVHIKLNISTDSIFFLKLETEVPTSEIPELTTDNKCSQKLHNKIKDLYFSLEFQSIYLISSL